jgi:hypothetical protein
MKVIISSKVYPKFIKKAIGKGFEHFTIYGQSDTIEFHKSGKTSQINDMHAIVEDQKLDFSGEFNHLQWYKLSEFLKQLPEQPITLEFQSYDGVSIIASHIKVTF